MCSWDQSNQRDKEEARLGRGTLGLSVVLAEAPPAPQNPRALSPSQARGLVTQCLGRQFLERPQLPQGDPEANLLCGEAEACYCRPHCCVCGAPREGPGRG